ncbi:putative amino-acid permease protein YxeN [compost metagenome]
MTAQGKIIAGNNYRYFEVYVALSIIYWALTIVIEQGIKRIEKKMSINDVKIVRRSGLHDRSTESV